MMYKERVLAYFDILGFSDRINNTIKNNTEKETKTKEINNLFDDVLKIKEKYRLDDNHFSSKVVSYFSDSIAISYLKNEEAGIFHILVNILSSSLAILQKGLLIRGAITCGKLYHTEEKLFGPAMITAVGMEEKLAIYPRIIFDNEIINIAEKYPAEYPSKNKQSKTIKNMILKDFDGLYYLNYFDTINFIVGPNNGILIYFKPFRKIIIELQKKAKVNIGIKSKYLWLKEKYNNLLMKYKKKYINENTKNKFPELYNYLIKINEIDDNVFV